MYTPDDQDVLSALQNMDYFRLCDADTNSAIRAVIKEEHPTWAVSVKVTRFLVVSETVLADLVLVLAYKEIAGVARVAKGTHDSPIHRRRL